MKDVSRLSQYLQYLVQWRVLPQTDWGKNVLLEQHKLVVKQMLVMALVSAMISASLAATFAYGGYQLEAAIWFGFAIAWSAMIWFGWLKIRNRPQPTEVSGRYLFKAEISAIYYGLVWGGLPFLFDMAVPMYTLLICVVTSSMMSGALALLPSLPRIVSRFAFCAFVPILTMAALSGTSVGLLVAAGTPSLIFAMLYGGRTSLSHLQQLVSQTERADQSRRLIFSVVESIEDPFALFDDEGNVLVSNDAYRVIDEAGLGQLINNQEIKHDGQWFLTRVTESTGLGRATTLRNISSLKERQAELEVALAEAEKAEAAKNRFLSVMSHQLRSPLTIIMGFSSLMGSDSNMEMDLSTVENYADDIHAAGETLLESIETIFAYTSLDEKLDLYREREYYDVNRLVDTEFETVSSRYPEKSLSLINMSDDENWVHGIPQSSFRRSLYNLLDNAARHSNIGGDIRILVKSFGEKICVCVEDFGVGMDDETLQNAVEPFWQPESKSFSTVHGPGLGLAFVKRFAEMYGGEFRLDSKRGVGTQATLVVSQFTGVKDWPQASLMEHRQN